MDIRAHNVGDIELADDYWDCECNSNYIHPYTEYRCVLCGAWSVEMPMSRAGEVRKARGEMTAQQILEREG